jgi:hypothetical protein
MDGSTKVLIEYALYAKQLEGVTLTFEKESMDKYD